MRSTASTIEILIDFEVKFDTASPSFDCSGGDSSRDLFVGDKYVEEIRLSMELWKLTCPTELNPYARALSWLNSLANLL